MSDYSIYSENIVDASLTIGTMTSNSDFPLTNLNDVDKNTKWKEGTGNTSGYIQIDLGETRTIDYLILVNHNYSNTGVGIKLETNLIDDGTFSDTEIFRIGTDVSYHDYEAANANIWFESVQSISKRYWRLHLEAMGAGTYQEIGAIFMGAAFDFDHNPNYEIPEDSGYIVNINETIGGSRFSQIANTTVRRSWELEYELIQSAEKTNLETFRDNIFMDLNGGLSRYPFVFTDDSGSNYYFARARGSLLFTPMAYQLYSTKLRFEEEL